MLKGQVPTAAAPLSIAANANANDSAAGGSFGLVRAIEPHVPPEDSVMEVAMAVGDVLERTGFEAVPPGWLHVRRIQLSRTASSPPRPYNSKAAAVTEGLVPLDFVEAYDGKSDEGEGEEDEDEDEDADDGASAASPSSKAGGAEGGAAGEDSGIRVCVVEYIKEAGALNEITVKLEDKVQLITDREAPAGWTYALHLTTGELGLVPVEFLEIPREGDETLEEAELRKAHEDVRELQRALDGLKHDQEATEAAARRERDEAARAFQQERVALDGRAKAAEQALVAFKNEAFALLANELRDVENGFAKREHEVRGRRSCARARAPLSCTACAWPRTVCWMRVLLLLPARRCGSRSSSARRATRPSRPTAAAARS